MTIAIIDYGTANVKSIQNMLRSIGADSIITDDQKQLLNARGIILPGVGAWDHGLNNLRNSGLVPTLERQVLHEKVPVLGICLGMQLLMNSSEEGTAEGLGWIDGTVKRIQPTSAAIKVPHMGWNKIIVRQESPLLKGLKPESRFYFVHSYYVDCNETNAIGVTEYEHEFTSTVQKENIFGAQFHPEKSHRYGKLILSNFANITE